MQAIDLATSPADWLWLGERIPMPGLLRRLLDGNATAYRVSGTETAVVTSIGKTKDTDTTAMWVIALGGKSKAGPHENYGIIRDVVSECEQIARDHDCSEIRIEAKNRGALKCRLFEPMGFVAETILGGLVLRKVL